MPLPGERRRFCTWRLSFLCWANFAGSRLLRSPPQHCDRRGPSSSPFGSSPRSTTRRVSLTGGGLPARRYGLQGLGYDVAIGSVWPILPYAVFADVSPVAQLRTTTSRRAFQLALAQTRRLQRFVCQHIFNVPAPEAPTSSATKPRTWHRRSVAAADFRCSQLNNAYQPCHRT